MEPCSHCGRHLSRSALFGRCPHCGQSGSTGTGPTAVALLLGLTLAACNGDAKDSTSVHAEYGVADTGYLDADGDGYEAAESFGDDCDDGDETVHPGAEETPGDGVDQDCDGVD